MKYPPGASCSAPGANVALTLTGQNLGDATVTISLHNRSDEVLAQRTIEVAVR